MPEVIHVFSEQDSKGSLLAEVHRLQSSLAAMRQARDSHGANSAYLMQERDRLQAKVDLADSHRRAAIECERKDCERALVALSGAGICTPEETYGTNTSWAVSDLCRAIDRMQREIEMSKQREVAPAPVDAGLIERMCDAFTFGSHRIGYDEREGMTAALRVAEADRDAKWEKAIREEFIITSGNPWVFHAHIVDTIVSHVRARLLVPAKSVEERVVDILKRTHGDFGYKAVAAEIIAATEPKP